MRRGWKILIGVGAALAVLLGLNTVIVDHETKPAAVTEPGGRLLELPGGEIEVVEKGPRGASPIVLIHCFSCAINYWNGMIPLLAREHRVIAVDLLGHGGSEKPTSGYTVPDQADLVAQALGRLGVRDAVVVGHSLGGSIAVGLAERSPQLVKKVMIVEHPARSLRQQSRVGREARLRPRDRRVLLARSSRTSRSRRASRSPSRRASTCPANSSKTSTG